MASDLSPQFVAQHLTTTWLGQGFHYEKEVDSTNSRLSELARRGGRHGTVLVADEQTQGRGRLGRIWQSPPGVNLYCSILLRPQWPAALTPWISLVAGVAVADALESFLPIAPQLKWPNDVYYRGKKLAGILAEAGTDSFRCPYVILGIGVNVNQEHFPPPLDDQAVSLSLAAGQSISRGNVLAAMLGRLEFWIDCWLEEGEGPVVKQWVRRADWLGKPIKVRWGSSEIMGTAMGLGPDGALRLKDEHGLEHSIYCGDASLLLETIGCQPGSSIPTAPPRRDASR